LQRTAEDPCAAHDCIGDRPGVHLVLPGRYASAQLLEVYVALIVHHASVDGSARDEACLIGS
jgi:hypothetical protein